jgi:hypothetical protein
MAYSTLSYTSNTLVHPHTTAFQSSLPSTSMSRTRQLSSNTSTAKKHRQHTSSNNTNNNKTFGFDTSTVVAWVITIISAIVAIDANIKNPAAVKDKAIADATNMLVSHIEVMDEEKRRRHVRRSYAEEPIRTFLKSFSNDYALIHGPSGCGKSEAVLAALIEEEEEKADKSRRGVLKVKVKGEGVSIVELLCNELGIEGGDDRTLEMVLRGAKEKLGGAKPVLIIELDRQACSREHITTATVFAKDITADKLLCKVIIVLSDNAAVNTTTKGGDSRHKLIWVGDMDIDAAKSLLEKRMFDPKDMGFGKVEDDKDKAFRKVFAKVGTRAEVLVGILGSMESGQSLGREMAAAKGTSVREAETREAKREVLRDIQDRKDTIDLRLRLLLEFNAGGDVVKTKNKQETIKIIRQILDVRETEEKSATAKNKEVEVEFVPSVLTADTGLQPTTLSRFMREIDVNCHPIIYHPPSKSYRFHSTMAEEVARNSTMLAAEEKKLAAEELAAAEEEKIAAARRKWMSWFMSWFM